MLSIIFEFDLDNNKLPSNTIYCYPRFGDLINYIKNEFNVIADKNTKIADGFKFSAIPVTIIFNRGKVVHFSNGPMDFNSAEMVEKIKKLNQL